MDSVSSLQTYRPPAAGVFPFGQATRRGPLREGDRVQITDPKGRLHTVVLVTGGLFQCSRGKLRHDDLIGGIEGTTFRDGEAEFHVVRPRLADYVLSMPRGAAIIYPKDCAQILAESDIFPGAKVVEAGVGSGALSLFLLNAIGEQGQLLSVERRDDFAQIAQGNVDTWFGCRHPAWQVQVGDFNDAASALAAHSVDRVVLDMLEPWECLAQAARILVPGGIITVYVASVTQLSRLREEMVASQRFSNPSSSETLVRTWHLEGLAVRPDHRMVAHTGFLLTARTVAAGSQPQRRRCRPAPGAVDREGQWDSRDDWSADEQLNPVVSDKKVRRSRRQVSAHVNRWVLRVGGADDEEMLSPSNLDSNAGGHV